MTVSGRERPPDRWGSVAATFGFVRTSVDALAMALGYPEDRLDDIWNHLSGQPLPSNPFEFTALVQLTAADIGVTLERPHV